MGTTISFTMRCSAGRRVSRRRCLSASYAGERRGARVRRGDLQGRRREHVVRSRDVAPRRRRRVQACCGETRVVTTCGGGGEEEGRAAEGTTNAGVPAAVAPAGRGPPVMGPPVVGMPAVPAFGSNFGFRVINREEGGESIRADMERRLDALRRKQVEPSAPLERSKSSLR
jgi:hypothetical protein